MDPIVKLLQVAKSNKRVRRDVPKWYEDDTQFLDIFIENKCDQIEQSEKAIVKSFLKLEDQNKRDEVEDVLKGLRLTCNDVRRIQEAFFSEMRLGLGFDAPTNIPSSLQMENTYIPELPDGTENGQFLALDLGGTNSRVILLELENGVVQHEVVNHFHVPDYLRVGSGHHLFDFLAKCLHDFVVDKGLQARRLPLGFTFSFPMRQHSLDCGVLLTWTKCFHCPSAVGRDAVAMLREAIARRGDLQVDVVAVLNDTTGTLVQGAFKDKRTAIGLIIATGSNACYLQRVENGVKGEVDYPNDQEVIIDIEWGAFGDNGVIDFIKTDFDLHVDNISLNAKNFTFEKYISGKYLGELVRIILLRLTSKNLLFNGEASDYLMKIGHFPTSYISLIETDSLNHDHKNTTEILKDLKLSFDDDDMEIVKYVCHVVSNRAALLVSICVAGLLTWMDRDDSTIAVDGSMFKFHPRLQTLMETYITLLAPGKEFRFMLTEDGSGKGAGLVAAIAQKLQTRRQQGF